MIELFNGALFGTSCVEYRLCWLVAHFNMYNIMSKSLESSAQSDQPRIKQSALKGVSDGSVPGMHFERLVLKQ